MGAPLFALMEKLVMVTSFEAAQNCQAFQ